MSDKLTKTQRIYARQKLMKHQGGECAECSNQIVDIRPGIVLAQNWRRAALTKKGNLLVLMCQHCNAATSRKDDFAAVDELLGLT